MEKLILGKRSRASVIAENIFYGKSVAFELASEGKPLSVALEHHKAQLTVKLGLKLGESEGTLYLEKLPPLEAFSEKFAGIDIRSLPEELQLLVLQGALDHVLDACSKGLSVGIRIMSLEFLSETPKIEGIDFVIHQEEHYLTAGALVAEDAIRVKLVKLVKPAPKLRNLDALTLPYKLRIGKTFLSRSNYADLEEDDIIFLDEYGIEKEGKVHIEGLGSLAIEGKLSPAGVIVEQIG